MTLSAPDTTAPRVLSPHWANLDRLRLLALVDIVSFHAGTDQPRWLGGMGLPVFLIAAVMLSAKSAQPQPWGKVLAPRVRRVILPWLVWCIVYGLYLPGREYVITGPDAARAIFNWSMLLYGTATHLWFLPFIFVLGLAVRAMQPGLLRCPTWAVVGGGLGGGLALACVHPPQSWAFPLMTWWFALPGLPIGVALGRLAMEHRLHGRAVAVAAAALTVIGVVCLAQLGLEPPVGRFALATGLVGLAVAWPVRNDRVSAALVPLIYGIYLLHPLMFLVTIDTLGYSYPLLIATGLIGSGLVVWALRRAGLERLM